MYWNFSSSRGGAGSTGPAGAAGHGGAFLGDGVFAVNDAFAVNTGFGVNVGFGGAAVWEDCTAAGGLGAPAASRYSPDMYTASKRAAEWVASGVAAGSDMLISAGRFTHVLDNSTIDQRLLSWADEPEDGVIRLHSPDIAFYVQSALESAQLLLLACLGSARGEFRVLAISDLGWPAA